MNIKAQALLNAVKWIEETHGTERLAAVIKACSPPVRERYMTALAIEWHPQAEFVELLHVAERVLGGPPGEIAKAIGAEGARVNTRGMAKRAAMYVGTPEFLLRRIASLWSQFNDTGAMNLRSIDPTNAMIEITDLPAPDALFCATVTGWCDVIGVAVGFTKPRSEHVTCRARGDAACVWRVRFLDVRASPSVRPER
jgi:hypothetical protein